LRSFSSKIRIPVTDAAFKAISDKLRLGSGLSTSGDPGYASFKIQSAN
jgi:hypothetical protein